MFSTQEEIQKVRHEAGMQLAKFQGCIVFLYIVQAIMWMFLIKDYLSK